MTLMWSSAGLLRKRIRPAWAIFFGALLYRLAAGFHFLQVGGMAAQWTNEYAAVAHSLLLRHSYGGAYSGYEGPTAWVAPGYTFLVTAVFWLFGIDSYASAVVMLLLNVLISSLTAVVIYKLGRDYLSERVGVVAGWIWALSPIGVLMPLLLWDTSLAALMFALSLMAFLRARSGGQWAAAGAMWGATALVSPSLLAPLPAMLVARLWRDSSRFRSGLVFCLTLICMLVPWSIRNHVTMGAVFPVRSNGWAEIYFGNITFATHPCASPTGLYQHVGETRFVARMKQDTIQYLRGHAGEFAWRSLQRAAYFWVIPTNFLPLTLLLSLGCWVGAVGLLRNQGMVGVPLVLVVVFYPVIYSMAHIETRYRHPIDPVICLLAAYAGCEIFERTKTRRQARKNPGDASLTAKN